MPVTVTVRDLGLPKPLIDAAFMREIGTLAMRLIRTRTEKGVDRSGNAFQAYTPAYAEQRSKAGLGTLPNLTVSGRMLNDMAVTDATPNKATIGFRSSGGKATGRTFIQRSRAVGAEDKARWHDREGAGKSRVKREFLGLTDEEVGKVRTAVERHLETIVARLR